MHYSLKLVMPTTQVSGTRENIEPVMNRLKRMIGWDWFLIGGRWSGSLNQRFSWFEQFEQQFEQIKKNHGIEHFFMPEYGDKIPVRRSQMPAYYEIEKAWHKHSALPPNLGRDSYRKEGYRDDIAPVDELMKRWLMSRYPGATHCWRDEFRDYYLYISDKKHLTKLPTDGSYTVILVDYHS